MALAHYQGYVENVSTGKALPDAVIRVYSFPANVLQSTFADPSSTPKPVVSSDANGAFNFYIPDGVYDLEYVYNGDVLTRLTNIPIYNPANALPAAELAASGGSALVGFSHANTYAAGTAGKSLNRTIYIENAPYNAKGDGTTDDTAAWQAALDSGASAIITRPGANYKVGQLDGHSANLKFIGAEGVWRMTCTASLNSIGLNMELGLQFMEVKNLHIYSSGNGSDGFNAIGIRSDSAGLIYLNRCRNFGFSGCGVQIRGCVEARLSGHVSTCDAGTPAYGVSFEKLLTVPCTTVTVDQLYAIGGKRALNADGVVGLMLKAPAFESAGDATTVDGALHLVGCSGEISGEYYEGNNRDVVMTDCILTRGHTIFKSGAGAADSITYSGVSFGDRGLAKLTSRALTVTEIVADPYSEGTLKVTGRTGFNTFPTAGYDLHCRSLTASEYRVRFQTDSNTCDFIAGAGGALGGGEFGFIIGGAPNIKWQYVSGSNGLGLVVDGANTRISLNGTQVLTTRGVAIAAPTGGATVDAESRTAINAIRAELARHGLIA